MDWNKFYEDNRALPMVPEFEKEGFEIIMTGGGCSALSRTNNDKTTFVITCPDDPAIPSAEYPATFIGHYAAGGWENGEEEINGHEFPSMADALVFIKAYDLAVQP